MVFGKEAREHFQFEQGWTNLNHGSFGGYPKAIRTKLHQHQDAYEFHPDQYIRYEYPTLLDESRHGVEQLLHAPKDTVVFIPNATVGINTIFRNLRWNEDGLDVIITFSTIYEACAKIIDYIIDSTGKIRSTEIDLVYPLEDSEILDKFRETVKGIITQGKRPRLCVFDVVSSRPGVPFPWIQLTHLCRELGIISVVDGAQGIGMVDIDLGIVDPDYFVTNCHKWLFVPRACALLYVPLRNQYLITTTLATSHGYVPKTIVRNTPLPPTTKSPFVHNFEYVGTLDNSPYLCAKDAIEWRKKVFGGEEEIRRYISDLNRKGSEVTAKILGTFVMENQRGNLRNCAMANVALPVYVDKENNDRPLNVDGVALSGDDTGQAFQWMLRKMMEDHKTFIAMFIHNGRFWARLSAQVYLDLDDYAFAGKVLRNLCERVSRREYVES